MRHEPQQQDSLGGKISKRGFDSSTESSYQSVKLASAEFTEINIVSQKIENIREISNNNSRTHDSEKEVRHEARSIPENKTEEVKSTIEVSCNKVQEDKEADEDVVGGKEQWDPKNIEDTEIELTHLTTEQIELPGTLGTGIPTLKSSYLHVEGESQSVNSYHNSDNCNVSSHSQSSKSNNSNSSSSNNSNINSNNSNSNNSNSNINSNNSSNSDGEKSSDNGNDNDYSSSSRENDIDIEVEVEVEVPMGPSIEYHANNGEENKCVRNKVSTYT